MLRPSIRFSRSPNFASAFEPCASTARSYSRPHFCRKPAVVIKVLVTSVSQSVYCSFDLDRKLRSTSDTLQTCSFASAVLCRIAHTRSATLLLLTDETVNCDQFSGTGSLILTVLAGLVTNPLNGGAACKQEDNRHELWKCRRDCFTPALVLVTRDLTKGW